MTLKLIKKVINYLKSNHRFQFLYITLNSIFYLLEKLQMFRFLKLTIFSLDLEYIINYIEITRKHLRSIIIKIIDKIMNNNKIEENKIVNIYEKSENLDNNQLSLTKQILIATAVGLACVGIYYNWDTLKAGAFSLWVLLFGNNNDDDNDDDEDD